MQPVTVFIITASHNRKASTSAFCESLRMQTYSNFVLILVDDGSTDGTADAVAEYSFRKEICHGDGNLWWAGGVRKGIARLKAIKPSQADIVLIANDDTTFAPDFLDKAVREMERHKSPTMLCVSVSFTDSHGSTDGGSVCLWHRLTFRHYGRHPEKIDCASTRCLFLRYSDVAKAGSFRPRLLPHYLSDYEFTIRARRRGIILLPAETVTCQSTEHTTGSHAVPKGSVPYVMHFMISPRFSANPVSLFAFVLLAAPLQWKVVCWLWALRTVLIFFFKATVFNRMKSKKIAEEVEEMK